MPVEAENAAEGLEPVRIGNSSQDFFRAVVLDDEPDDFSPQTHHSLKQPGRRFAAVERELGNAGVTHSVCYSSVSPK
jgi:hypothetical protein